MEYAVFKTGGKQYRVRPGDTLDVEKLPVNVAVIVYSPEGYGIVPRVPHSLAPGPQKSANIETDAWSLNVKEILEPEPLSASMK